MKLGLFNAFLHGMKEFGKKNVALSREPRY